jgi:hypothetical protein
MVTAIKAFQSSIRYVLSHDTDVNMMTAAVAHLQ